MPKTIFEHIISYGTILSKVFKSISYVLKDLPEAKTSEINQQLCHNSKFIILDYLPCQNISSNSDHKDQNSDIKPTASTKGQ